MDKSHDRLKRRSLLISIGSLTAIAGCIGNTEDEANTASSPTTAPGSPTTEEPSNSPTSGPTDTSEPTETQASFTVQNLTVNPSEVNPGEPTTATIEVMNEGGSAGLTDVELFVDGNSHATKTVNLDAESSTRVQFQISLDDAGTHELEVGGQITELKVVSLTEVGGIIDGDTNWTTSDSPYAVTSTVQIPETGSFND